MPYGTDVRGPICVLYVDDEPGIGAGVEEALAQRGHTVIHAGSSDECFARLAEGGIDVIALNHVLPGGTGFEVLNRLGPRGARPPVVYVARSADVRIALQAIKDGADDYVIKDVSGEFYELLIAGIEQVLERWRLRRQTAADLKAVGEARDQAELLLHEVNHRIANSLGLVAAMVRLQAAVLQDPAAVQALQETQARITAIAGVHRHLYTSYRVGLVAIDDYLDHLVEELRSSLADDGHPYRVTLLADRLEISTDKAVALGVITGELVTNAFKYAYGKGEAGEIRVGFRALTDNSARLTVEDDGNGAALNGPVRGTGLGSRILVALASNLNAVIEQEGAPGKGTRIQLDFPLK